VRQICLPNYRSRNRGLTLLEVVVATLITGVMLVVSLDAIGAVFQSNLANADRLTGPGLAHELMAEIMSLPYVDPSFDSGAIGSGPTETTRADFNDVDDYDDMNTLGIRTKSGTSVAGYTDWRQQVNVEFVEIATGLTWATDTGLKRITVTITSPEGDVTQLVGYRYKEGVLEQAPAIDMTAVSWLGAEIQIGATGTAVRMGVNLPNHTPDVN
jgi:MSHA pilin protein MshD